MNKYKDKSQLIKSICNIENNSILFDFKLKSIDVSLWALVRFVIIQQALNKEFSLSTPWIKSSMSLSGWYRYFILTLKYSAIKMPTSDIIMFGSDISNVEIGNSYFNRLNEHFAKVFPEETCLIEKSNFYSYKRPRTFNKVFSQDGITLLSLLKNKLFRKIGFSSRYNKNIEDFILFLKKNIQYDFDEDFYSRIRKVLIIYEGKAPIIYKKYYNLFVKKRPKLIFLEEGCYGADSVMVIRAARKLNIHITEIQHGYIGMDHPAYVYSSDICKEYIRYLPNELITYGKYWSDNIQIPIPTVIIGSPYLNEANTMRSQKKLSNRILYVSSGINPASIIREIIQLKKLLDIYGYKITFRPHPLEYHNLHEVYSLIFENNIEIDKANIYDSLAKYKYVISNALSPSTTMYEAIAFNCRPIYINDESSRLKEEFFLNI